MGVVRLLLSLCCLLRAYHCMLGVCMGRRWISSLGRVGGVGEIGSDEYGTARRVQPITWTSRAAMKADICVRPSRHRNMAPVNDDDMTGRLATGMDVWAPHSRTNAIRTSRGADDLAHNADMSERLAMGTNVYTRGHASRQDAEQMLSTINAFQTLHLQRFGVALCGMPCSSMLHRTTYGVGVEHLATTSMSTKGSTT